VNEKSGRARIVNENREPGCGDASACLKLRTSVTRRDRPPFLQDACPRGPFEITQKNGDNVGDAVLGGGHAPVLPWGHQMLAGREGAARSAP
jgi:hypothetical protein